jgi:uncharacterized membrane protein YkvI
MIQTVVSQLETQSLNALVAGFSFASAIAWMDVVRVLVALLIKSNRQTPGALTITAVLTTVLSILVFLSLSKVSKRVTQPAGPVYAVAR